MTGTFTSNQIQGKINIIGAIILMRIITTIIADSVHVILNCNFKFSCRNDQNKDIYHEDGYILKIANTLEDPEVLKGQNELMLHLHNNKNIKVS